MQHVIQWETGSYNSVLKIVIYLLILFPDTLKRVKVKGKAIPLQAWTSPEGSRRLKLPDFKTIGT